MRAIAPPLASMPTSTYAGLPLAQERFPEEKLKLHIKKRLLKTVGAAAPNLPFPGPGFPPKHLTSVATMFWP
jgi:hypothetical protein